jgi:hypothetical protein
MRRDIRILFVIFATLMLSAVTGNTAFAQHLISSKAGFVNHTTGKVFILRQDSVEGEKGRVSLGTQMREGDKISTDTNGFAEVLLNPGSYLRLDEESEVRAVNTNLSQVRFELIKGSAIVEIGEIDKKLPVEIMTPHGALFITKTGLHRFDTKGEMTLVAVRQGEIYLGTREEVLANKAFKIGRGKVAQLTGTATPNLAKIDKDLAADNFDIYSFNRAEKLMAANQMALRQSRRSGSLAYGWIYDPFFSCYTYIPRRGWFWSPYGFGFANSWGNCYSCGYWPYGYGYGNGGWTGGGGGSTGGAGVPPRVITGLDRTPIRREIEGRRIDSSPSIDSGSRGDFGRSGSSRSISSPPPSTSSPISSPAPSRAESRGTSGGRTMPSRP